MNLQEKINKKHATAERNAKNLNDIIHGRKPGLKIKKWLVKENHGKNKLYT